jgi:hypothetical protein
MNKFWSLVSVGVGIWLWDKCGVTPALLFALGCTVFVIGVAFESMLGQVIGLLTEIRDQNEREHEEREGTDDHS